jgi:hypothetical protein
MNEPVDLAPRETLGDIAGLIGREGEGLAHRVSHRGSALPQGPCGPRGRIQGGLVLDLGVQLGADEQDHE